jgi:hypothetical protein
MITLNVNEILDLAIFAGIPIVESYKPTEDEGEETITIGECPEKGLFDEEAQFNRQYRFMAWLEEYPEEGSYGLGPELNSNSTT